MLARRAGHTIGTAHTKTTWEMHPDMAGEVWSVVKHLADKTGVESSAGYNGQPGIDTHIPLMGQQLGVGGR
jgi:hypothetical protein